MSLELSRPSKHSQTKAKIKRGATVPLFLFAISARGLLVQTSDFLCRITFCAVLVQSPGRGPCPKSRGYETFRKQSFATYWANGIFAQKVLNQPNFELDVSRCGSIGLRPIKADEPTVIQELIDVSRDLIPDLKPASVALAHFYYKAEEDAPPWLEITAMVQRPRKKVCGLASRR